MSFHFEIWKVKEILVISGELLFPLLLRTRTALAKHDAEIPFHCHMDVIRLDVFSICDSSRVSASNLKVYIPILSFQLSQIIYVTFKRSIPNNFMGKGNGKRKFVTKFKCGPSHERGF